jgi:hypothetical protein
MAFVVGRFEVGDYWAWKEMFDLDPAGRKQSAKGHQILRSADNPGEVFVQVEFPSAEEARSFRERLLASGALERDRQDRADGRRGGRGSQLLNPCLPR